MKRMERVRRRRPSPSVPRPARTPARLRLLAGYVRGMGGDGGTAAAVPGGVSGGAAGGGSGHPGRMPRPGLRHGRRPGRRPDRERPWPCGARPPSRACCGVLTGISGRRSGSAVHDIQKASRARASSACLSASAGAPYIARLTAQPPKRFRCRCARPRVRGSSRWAVGHNLPTRQGSLARPPGSSNTACR